MSRLSSRHPLYWIYAGCFVLTLLIAIGVIREIFFPKQLELQNVQLLPNPQSLISVELGTEDFTVDLQQARDRWLLVFFGFTSCPDICPVELQKLGRMLKRIEEKKWKEKPFVVFVSVDPERDDGVKLESYGKYFHPEIAAISGKNIELAKLAKFFGAAYHRSVAIGDKEYLVEAGADMPAGSGENYAVHHSGRIFIINPKGEYVGSFSPPLTEEQLFADMKELMGQ